MMPDCCECGKLSLPLCNKKVKDMKEWLYLIAAIAFEQDAVVLDANVLRLFSRLFDLSMPPYEKAASDFIESSALAMLPSGQARSFDQALMELGEVICTKSPRCSACPLAFCCRARAAGTAPLRPVAAAKPAVIPVCSVHGILLCNGRALVRQRPEGGLWARMWEFPGCACDDGDRKAALSSAFAALGLQVRVQDALGSVSHSYTNHRLTAHFYSVSAEPAASQALCAASNSLRLADPAEISGLPMPAHHRKMAGRFFSSLFMPR